MPFPPGSSTPLGLAFYLGARLTGNSVQITQTTPGLLPPGMRAHSPTGSKRDFASNRARPAWPLRRPVPGPAGINLAAKAPHSSEDRGTSSWSDRRGKVRQAGTDGAARYSCLIPVAGCKPRSRSAERVWRSLQIWPHGMRRICQSSLGEFVSHHDVAVSVISLGAGTPKRGRSSKRTPTVKKHHKVRIVVSDLQVGTRNLRSPETRSYRFLTSTTPL